MCELVKGCFNIHLYFKISLPITGCYEIWSLRDIMSLNHRAGFYGISCWHYVSHSHAAVAFHIEILFMSVNQRLLCHFVLTLYHSITEQASMAFYIDFVSQSYAAPAFQLKIIMSSTGAGLYGIHIIEIDLWMFFLSSHFCSTISQRNFV